MKLRWKPASGVCPVCGDTVIPYEVRVNDHHFSFPIYILWCMDCLNVYGIVKPPREKWNSYMKKYHEENPKVPDVQQVLIHLNPEPSTYTLLTTVENLIGTHCKLVEEGGE
ncbi:MAG: hypothetical protein HXS54_06295 [Theionarchaea archaeon]|nr:hypothetical protein [Theionarchaea archaeon]DBA34869.1 TPA_asm: hypothetical protein vir521_00075 [Caudoviricetes sp. vir521]